MIDEEGKQVNRMIGAMKMEIIKELERLKKDWRRKMREKSGRENKGNGKRHTRIKRKKKEEKGGEEIIERGR